MKRIISIIAIIAILATLGVTAFIGSTKKDDTQLRIGYMAGPTGMGMAKLIHDEGGMAGNEKYSFTKYADTAQAKADLAAGKIDIICLPTNEAAAYYNTYGGIKVLAINCLNSLYLLSDKSTTVTSVDDLDGQTIYTCKNGTPRAVLEYVIKEAGINATVSYTYNDTTILTPADLGTLVTAGHLPIAVMPEPIITSSLLAIQKNGNTDIEYSIDLDLDEIWEGIHSTPITMGCIVASEASLKLSKASINAFLSEYEASVNFIGNPENVSTASNYVVETEIMAAAPAATKALKNLGDAISYIDGDDMKDALIAFYNAINVKSPGSEFYYNE